MKGSFAEAVTAAALVLGEQEQEASTINIRTRDELVRAA